MVGIVFGMAEEKTHNRDCGSRDRLRQEPGDRPCLRPRPWEVDSDQERDRERNGDSERDSSHARRRDRDVCGREKKQENTPNRTTVPDDRESKKRVNQRNRPI